MIAPHLRTRELIVSGVLTERRDEVIAALRNYGILAERTKGEWWAARLDTLPSRRDDTGVPSC